MNVGAYELIGDWKVSNVGFTALAMRGHKNTFSNVTANIKTKTECIDERQALCEA